MFQRYKLRLGDGTVLLVDLDGLSAWQMDGDALVQPVGSRKWHPLKQFLAHERAAARRAASPPASSAPREPPLVPPPPKKRLESAPRELPLVPPPKKHPESAPAPAPEDQAVLSEAPGPVSSAPRPVPPGPAAPVPAAAPPAETVEPPPIGEPPGLLTLADEPGGPAPAAGAPPPWAQTEDAVFVPLKPVDEAVPVRPAPAPRREMPEPPRLSSRPSVGVLADDPMAAPARRTVKGPEPDDSLPVIPLKPVDDEARVHVVESEGDMSGELDLGEDVPWHEPSSETALPLFAALGGLLSEWLDRLTELGRRLPSLPISRRGQALRLSPTALRQIGRTASTWAEELARWLRRVVEQVSGLTGRIRGLSGRLFALARTGGLTATGGSVSEPAERQVRPLPPPAPMQERPSIVDGLEPRVALRPPPPVSELPSLRFRDTREPSVPEDLYAAEEGPGFFDVAWLWTRRALALAVLVAAAAYAVLTWDVWSPTAAWLSQSLFAEIDRYARPATGPVGLSPEALQAAEDQLPHLAPESIRLLASSRRGALDAPDLFYLADEAADRGLSALGPQQAAELAALRRDLLETLRPAERERLRQYDRERSRRAMFAFEKRRALELFARGVRAVPVQSRQRLQELLARAIASGLGRPSQVAPWDAGRG
jgi:hypothetical protein